MVEERHLPFVQYAIVILTLAVLFSQGTQGSESVLCFLNAIYGYKYQSVHNSWKSLARN